MKKMLAFELISYGFRPTFNLPDDQRLTVEGKDFNDFSYGAGWSKKKAIQFAIELIEEHGVEASKELNKAWHDASDEENGDQHFMVGVRFLYDRAKEDAERDANIDRLWQERHDRMEALTMEGVDMDPAL